MERIDNWHRNNPPAPVATSTLSSNIFCLAQDCSQPPPPPEACCIFEEIDDLDEFRKTKDSFWFNQVFDRFIHRWYDVIPTSQVINVPEKVKKALDERWKYICLETSRVKELTSAVKTCKRCVGFCAT